MSDAEDTASDIDAAPASSRPSSRKVMDQEDTACSKGARTGRTLYLIFSQKKEHILYGLSI